jgi:hypothetical protein
VESGDMAVGIIKAAKKGGPLMAKMPDDLHTKKSKFWSILKALEWKILLYFVAIWYFVWSFGMFCGHLECFTHFGKLHEEKSGNPEQKRFLR